MIRIISIFSICILTSCTATKNSYSSFGAESHLTIYKTTSNYYSNVSINLNNERDKITSFPDPTDLFFEGQLALPEKLKDGFLLDKRGINSNSVFTSYTYAEYSKFDTPPSLQELYDSVIDEYPLLEIHDCGKRSDYKNLNKGLNKFIKKLNKSD